MFWSVCQCTIKTHSRINSTLKIRRGYISYGIKSMIATNSFMAWVGKVLLSIVRNGWNTPDKSSCTTIANYLNRDRETEDWVVVPRIKWMLVSHNVLKFQNLNGVISSVECDEIVFRMDNQTWSGHDTWMKNSRMNIFILIWMLQLKYQWFT